jgi:hypothetical protein
MPPSEAVAISESGNRLLLNGLPWCPFKGYH